MTSWKIDKDGTTRLVICSSLLRHTCIGATFRRYKLSSASDIHLEPSTALPHRMRTKHSLTTATMPAPILELADTQTRTQTVLYPLYSRLPLLLCRPKWRTQPIPPLHHPPLTPQTQPTQPWTIPTLMPSATTATFPTATNWTSSPSAATPATTPTASTTAPKPPTNAPTPANGPPTDAKPP